MTIQIAQMDTEQPAELIQALPEEQQASDSCGEEEIDVEVESAHRPPAAAPASSPTDAPSGGLNNESEHNNNTNSAVSAPQEPESAIKFLVPNYLAGSLIGKKGATIKDVQLKTSCMVRIATSGMYYPGTMERAVLVAGELDGVKKACSLILHTLHVPDNNESGCAKLVDSDKADTTEVTQRMLIPLTAGGLVIGRKGANIAALLEASGAKVTLGQKADVKLHERLVTVQGKLTAANKAVEMLLDKLMEEPVLSRFVNLSVNYRGHGTSQPKASMAAGIATSPLPYQRVARDSPRSENASEAAGDCSDPSTPSADIIPAPAATVTAPASPLDAAAVVIGDTATSSPALVASAGSRAAMSPPRPPPSPARAARGGRGGGRIFGRGFWSGSVGSMKFQPQQPFRPQQQLSPYRQPHQQPPRQPQQQQQHRQQLQQHHHQSLQFRQQQPQHPHPQQHQRLTLSPARITPPSPSQPSHIQLPQHHPQQPSGSTMPPMPMMSLPLGPAGPMIPSPGQMGTMAPVSQAPPPSAMPMMGMSYAPPPSVATYPAGVGQVAPGMTAPVAMVGGDGQPHGYPATMLLPQQHQQQHQQQAMFPVEHVMTNPVAAAIATCQPTTTVTVGVPNNMIGAILGPGGAIISELQSLSGAKINVSQRDAFMPGTENRILTITGAPLATQTAQYLVSQKIEAFVERPRGW